MKLQLWTTANGDPDELLGEVTVDDDEWMDAQADSGSAINLIQDLAAEVNNGA